MRALPLSKKTLEINEEEKKSEEIECVNLPLAVFAVMSSFAPED